MTAAYSSSDNNPADTTLSTALTTLYRAVKALSFYPAGHPQREMNINIACEAVAYAVQKSAVIVKVSATGLSSQSTPLESTPAISSLAKELFARLIKQVVILPEVRQGDLIAFIELLAGDPVEIRRSGGASKLLAEKSVTSIVLNDIDLPRAGGSVAPATEEIHNTVAQTATTKQDPGHIAPREQKKSLFDYIALMAAEVDDGRYIVLGQHVVTEAMKIRTTKVDTVVETAAFLYREAQKPVHSGVKREHARKYLEILCDKQLTETLLDRVEGRHPSSATYLSILAALGTAGVRAIIGRLFVAKSIGVRKMLAAAVVKTGDAALPCLREALTDERWYVVRNAVSIMAAIGTPEVAYDLEEAANQPHEKVMKEAILGLSKVSAPEAEQILLRLAEAGTPAQSLLAVHALGLKRSRLAVQPLLRIVTRRDLFLRRFSLKREAIVALGAIADPEAAETLVALITSRHFIAAGRWHELKLWCITALAAIDDESVAAHLEKLSTRSGAIGAACKNALEERRAL